MKKFLKLSVVLEYEPLAKALGVSKVARSARGFLAAYKKAKTKDKLSKAWLTKRKNFIARHMAQLKKNKEPLWVPLGGALAKGSLKGKPSIIPTKRHLALIMWAYSPSSSVS